MSRSRKPHLFLVFAVAAAASAAEPPIARKVDVVDRDFGLTLPDPYRWMEGEGNDEFDAWLKAQGAYARARLDQLPTLESWRRKLAATAATGSSDGGGLVKAGGRLFYKTAEAGKEARLVVREADGTSRVLFDPNAEEGASFGVFSVSPDGGKVAIDITHGGNEAGALVVFDVATGAKQDVLKPVWDEFQASWLPDGSGFFYTRMRDFEPGDADPLQGMGAYLHKLGRPQSEDWPIARAGADDALRISANDFPGIAVAPGSDWAVLQISGARASGRLCVAPLAAAIAGNPAWRCIVDDAHNVQGADLHGDTLYLLSAKDAPNRQVLALDLRNANAALADAKVAVPERADVVLENFGVARDGLYLQSTRNGLGRIERMDYASGALTQVALPLEGTVSLATQARDDGAYLGLANWITPRKLYRYDGQTLADTGFGTHDVPLYPGLAVEETEATSDDGTKVPLSIIHRKDLALDGHARAVVYGYGGYGIGVSPAYSPLRMEWPQAGNVLAVCHVRGGGEKGDAWRIGGTGPNKQRGIEDFTACAKDLAKRGYSAPSRIGGFSGSMGGILTGGAYTTAPQAWGAMAVQAGVFNAVRIGAAKNGANQFAEMGDPRTEAGMKQLLAMDPYLRVQDGVEYPPLLLLTGLADQRVAPWNSGKFGARVLAASPTTPVWYRTDEATGHFATNANSQAEEMADVFAWFDAVLK